MADFWGVQKVAPEFDDNDGVSLIFVNSDKGKELTESLTFLRRDISVTEATKSNPSAYHSVTEPQKRQQFFSASSFSLGYLKTQSGLDTYGRIRRWFIEQILKLAKR